MPWQEIELAAGVLQNAPEEALKTQAASFENAFITEAKSWSRFPGLKHFAMSGQGRVYLFPYRGNLMASTSQGRLYRINEQGAATDVTDFTISGGGRTTFAETDDGLLMAAGGPITRYQGSKTERLSEEAPDATHVATLSGFVVAIAPRSGQFTHTAVGQYTIWNPLDVFSAEGKPDQLNALLVNAAGQLLATGPQSIETYEPSAGGANPFFRRAVSTTGVYAPFTLTDHESGSYALTQRFEVSVVGSGATSKSGPIQETINKIGKPGGGGWQDAWSQAVQIAGHDFLIVQAPKAINPYETEGLTLAWDITLNRWFFLYGWDTGLGRPARWPGWSIASLWGRTFVGGDGVVYELSKDFLDNAGLPLRPLWRSGHIEIGPLLMRIDDFRIRVKRGVGTNADTIAPQLSMRINRDGEGFGRLQRVDLGRPANRPMVKRLGPMGIMDTVQFEIMMTDSVQFELSGLAMNITPLSP